MTTDTPADGNWSRNLSTDGLGARSISPDLTYNGWTNWETWCVALWLGNDTAEWDREARRVARLVAHEPRAFRGFVEGYMWADGPVAACLATDLIGGALDRVNWQEIIDNLTEE